MMDDKKILIINLSKGRVGEVNATLLGSMLVTKIYLAAMSRADVAAKTLAELPAFYFYVDEFQSFANQSFADILSEARKYKLNLIIAHQYIEQMEEEVRDAVFGNVGTTIAFRVGPFDAEVLETIFQPQFTQADLVNLGFAQIYLTLMIDGVGSPPFSATTLMPFDPPPAQFVEETLAHSRVQFAKPRVEVEKALVDWSEPDSMAPKKAPSVSATAPAATSLRPPSAPQPMSPASRTTSTQTTSSLPRTTSTQPQQNPLEKKSGESFPKGSEDPRGLFRKTGSVESSAQPTHRAKTTTPYVPSPRPKQPERPPIEGAMSLKEALAMAQGKKQPTQEQEHEPTPAPATQPHHQKTPSLKEALGKIVGDQKSPVQLPEQTLRDMLRVDEPGNETT